MKIILNPKDMDTSQRIVFVGFIMTVISLFLPLYKEDVFGATIGIKNLGAVVRVIIGCYPLLVTISSLDFPSAVFGGIVSVIPLIWNICKFVSIVKDKSLFVGIGINMFTLGYIILLYGVAQDYSRYETVETKVYKDN